MLGAVAIAFALSGTLALVGQLITHHPGRWAERPIMAASVFAFFYFTAGSAYTTLDESGIRTRMYCFPRRQCPWSEVADIRVRDESSRTVRVTRSDGHRFTLGAPMTGTMLRDRDFDAKVEEIQAYWSKQAHLHDRRPTATATAVVRTPRRRNRLLGATLVVLAGAQLLLFGIVPTVDALNLLHHGARVQVSVVQIDTSNRPTQYLLFYEGPDADVPVYAWTSDVYGKTHVGDAITAVYDRSDPSTAKDLRVLSNWWVAPLVTGILTIVFGWFGVTVWRN
jgi:hypothetical protein